MLISFERSKKIWIAVLINFDDVLKQNFASKQALPAFTVDDISNESKSPLRYTFLGIFQLLLLLLWSLLMTCTNISEDFHKSYVTRQTALYICFRMITESPLYPF